MKKLLPICALILPLSIPSCTLDKDEMNRRGLANMQKAKQRHLDRIAKQNNRPATQYSSTSKTYAERAEASRIKGIQERNRVRRLNKSYSNMEKINP